MIFFKKYYTKYKSFVESRINNNSTDNEDTLLKWQRKFFIVIVLYLIPLSYVAAVPSVVLSLMEGMIVLAVVDIVGFAVAQYVFLNKTISFKNRINLFFVVLYAIGTALIFNLGWNGPGLIYIFGVSILSTLLHSRKAGWTTFLINFSIVAVIIILDYFDLTKGNVHFELNSASLLTIAINYVLFNLVVVIAISSLINGFKNKIDAEQVALDKLKIESEMHLQAKEKAEQSDKLKTAFLQNITHELRTPLNGIIGFTNLLKNRDISYDEALLYGDMIEQSSERLIEMVNNVIDLSLLETGLSEFNKSHFSLDSLIMDIFHKYEIKAKEKGLMLNLVGGADCNCLIYSDESKIYQVLSNLISNSIKFTYSGEIKFGFLLNEEYISFFVSDTGIGIDPAHYEKIFERFTQGDTSLNRSYEGSGIGLALCKGIAEQMGGRIRFESVLKEGSTFYFELPINIIQAQE